MVFKLGDFHQASTINYIGGEALYRVVIVDDEPLMLEGLRLMIEWQACGFEFCGEASSAQEALYLVDTPVRIF